MLQAGHLRWLGSSVWLSCNLAELGRKGVSLVSHGAGQLGEADLRLLRALQSEFPLVPEPYEAIAESLRLPEEDVLGRTRAFKTDGLIREIIATFDTRRLGYHSALVAMQTDPTRADEAAKVVNEHPGVSHNYLREDSYNLWFTLAVPTGSRLGVSGTVAVLERLVGSKATLVLPSLRMFKLDLTLPQHRTSCTCRAPHRKVEKSIVTVLRKPWGSALTRPLPPLSGSLYPAVLPPCWKRSR